MTDQPRYELSDLFAAYCEGELAQGDLAALETRLRSDPAVVIEFVAYMDVHAGFDWEFSSARTFSMDVDRIRGSATVNGSSSPAAADTRPTEILAAGTDGQEPESRHAAGRTPDSPLRPARSKSWLNRASRHPVVPSLGVAVALFAALFVGMAVTPMGQWIVGGGGDNKKDMKPATETKHVAILNNWHNAVWSEGTRPPLNDPRLKIGRRLKLASGLIEIKYNTGARVVIEGPAEFVVGRKAEEGSRHKGTKAHRKEEANSGFLKLGRLVARVEGKEAKGFTIDTPVGRVEDLGTEFVVDVSERGEAAIVVVDGEVNVWTQDGERPPVARLLKAGESVYVDTKLSIASLDPERAETLRRFSFVSATMTFGDMPGALIAHYNGEETSPGPLVDQVGGQTAAQVGAGHLYQQSSAPAGSYGAIKLSSSLGKAIGISGTNNGAWDLDAAESAELNRLTNDFTAMAWVFVPAGGFGTNDISRAIGDDATWDGDAWVLGVRNKVENVNSISFVGNGVLGWNSPNGTIINGVWQHIAATKSSTTGVTLYHNGIQVANFADATALGNLIRGNDIFGLARANADGTVAINEGMLIDEVRVYTTVLDADAIIAAAEAGQIRSTSPE